MDTVALIGRLLVSLAAVLGVMWLLARRARKGMKKKGSRTIEVLERANLSRSASVAVVRINDRAFVLGVAESQVSILGETDLNGMEGMAGAAVEAEPAPAVAPRASRATTSHRAPVEHRAPAEHRPSAEHRVFVPAPQQAPPATPRVQPTRTAPRPEQQTGALAGSALSPQTWKQTIESLRDLTARP